MAAPRLDALVDRLDPLETPLPQALVGQVIVAAADRLAARMRLAGAALRALAAVAERPVVEPGPASEWPFTHPLAAAGTWPHRAVLWVPDLHDAFENAQTNSTRLVTTQSPYILQIWHDALATRPDVTFLASAASPSLAEHAPEALTRRGPWRQAQLLEDVAADTGSVSTPADPPRLGPLAAAFRDASPAARLAAVGRALDEARTPGSAAGDGQRVHGGQRPRQRRERWPTRLSPPRPTGRPPTSSSASCGCAATTWPARPRRSARRQR